MNKIENIIENGWPVGNTTFEVLRKVYAARTLSSPPQTDETYRVGRAANREENLALD
jgi:hypothetical protein